MSPRTDSYLSLCLEQASKSPLHYRHGCIIVSGGKVIGRGYNHYRPGFNGGALKTGQLKSSSAFTSPAISVLRKKDTQKHTKTSGKQNADVKQQEPKLNFIPSENPALDSSGRGGHIINNPLSMHSEMMAIHSALSASGALTSSGSARSIRWLEKPCFKAPGDNKHQSRLRGLEYYVESVCNEEAIISGVLGPKDVNRSQRNVGKSYVQRSRFEACTDQFCQGQGRGVQGGKERGRRNESAEECEVASGQECGETPCTEAGCAPSQ